LKQSGGRSEKKEKSEGKEEKGEKERNERERKVRGSDRRKHHGKRGKE